MKIIKENTLQLCDVCGGTGIDEYNSENICPNCKGLKILNHFKIEFEFDIPYRDEETRNDNAFWIEAEIFDTVSKRMPSAFSMILPERRKH